MEITRAIYDDDFDTFKFILVYSKYFLYHILKKPSDSISEKLSLAMDVTSSKHDDNDSILRTILAQTNPFSKNKHTNHQ